MKYPLHNYTIRVDNVSALTFDDMKPSKEDERIHVELNDTTLPGVTLDGSFNLTITACSDITCRESDPADLSKCNICIQARPSCFVCFRYAEKLGGVLAPMTLIKRI